MSWGGGLDRASVSPPCRPRYGTRSSHPAGPRAKLRARTCPAAASPAPPASAPASRPRRAGSRIPIGARGAHTDPTGPRAACQACPSRAWGGRLAGGQERGDPAPGALYHSQPIPGIRFPAWWCAYVPGWARGGGGQRAGTPPQALPRDHLQLPGVAPRVRAIKSPQSQLPP